MIHVMISNKITDNFIISSIHNWNIYSFSFIEKTNGDEAFAVTVSRNDEF